MSIAADARAIALGPVHLTRSRLIPLLTPLRRTNASMPWVSPQRERLLLALYLLVTLGMYVHASLSIINQFCTFLNIRCLRLTQPARHGAAAVAK